MNNKVIELRRRLNALLEEMRAIHSAAATEKRSLSADEQTKWNELDGQANALQGEIEREERMAAIGGGGVTGQIGMSQREVQRYSFVRALRAAMDRNWNEAGLELEASQAVAKRTGRDPRSFFVPPDVLLAERRDLERRDLTAGTNNAGGYTVQTDVLGNSFISVLRNRMVVRQAGATILSDLVGKVAIPKQTAAGTAYWVAENNAPTESQQTLGQVTMSPTTVAAYTDYSRRLLIQSSIDVERFVQDDLAQILAIAIDLASLHGSGSSNQPTGIASTTGIGSVAGGDNGLAPAWSHIVQLETEVSVDNADVGRLGYVTNPKVRGKLKQTEKASGTAKFVWDDGQQPINGYPAYVTNQAKSDLTKGSSSGVCSSIFFGNWADLLIGMWGGLDVLVDPYSGSTAGTVRVVAFQDVDVAVRHAESFAAMLDALTS